MRALCSTFPPEYWRELDEQRAYPEAFVKALTEAGWLAALIPEEYGGVRPGRHRSVGHPGGDQPLGRQLRRVPRADVHHGHAAAARIGGPEAALPARHRRAASCGCNPSRVTEPTTGSDTTKLKTTAVRKGDRYVVNGQKVWISRVQHSDLMLLLARTTPLPEVKKKSEGLSVFLVDLRERMGKGMTVRPIRNMLNHETNEVFFDNLEVPADNLIGEEGKGFRYILDGMNAERILIAAECVGDGYWFLEKAARLREERVVFDRPIGQNQGIQFPIARAYVNVEAANLMRFKAAELFDAASRAGRRRTWPSCWRRTPRGRRPTSACRRTADSGSPPSTTSSASSARRACIRSRRFSTNLILSYVAEHVLGLPRSY